MGRCLYTWVNFRDGEVMAGLEEILRLGEKQPLGEVMNPGIFEDMVHDAMSKYKIGRGRAEKIATVAYLKTAKGKFGKSEGKKNYTVEALQKMVEV